MHKLVLVLALTMAACLAAAAVAAADTGTPIQVAGQSATTAQQAGAASSATQVDPTNVNISIRVLSPGNDGNVSQANTAASSAAAGNQAQTTQSADQSAAAGAIQSAQQAAGTDQLAAALSTADQVDPSNVNLGVRVLSPGDDGSVTQANSASSQADAGNAASTGQTSSQDTGGSDCGCGDPGIQTTDQTAATGQQAGAASAATQDHPSNTNLSIRVLSPGDGGSVTQTNAASSSAKAGNTASTAQGATQSQGGNGCGCDSAPAPEAAPETTGAASGASPDPAADPSAGGVAQGNTDASSAAAGNGASTGQQASQSAGSGSIQTGDQHAATMELAGAVSDATQIDPSNTSDPVRVLSPGSGGDVSQGNTVSSSSAAGNAAKQTQDLAQSQSGSCGCISRSPEPAAGPDPAIQVAGQDAWTGQAALAASSATQVGASNDASPVRVWSPGDDGTVSQQNTDASSASAGNAAWTRQQAEQIATPGGCGCSGGPPIQVEGQKAGTDQGAVALSKADQVFGGRESPCGCGGGGGSGNTASPVRVWSPGSDGSVSQQNAVGSTANAGNRAWTGQAAGQAAAGGGLAVQALGQEAATGQLGLAASFAAQLGARNDASPTRVLSPGGGGSVTEQNAAGSSAAAGNAAGTGQSAGQTIARGPCGCGGIPIQVAGQKADTAQLAKALSLALQVDPSNDASPVRVWSPGKTPFVPHGAGSMSGGAPGLHAPDGEAMPTS